MAQKDQFPQEEIFGKACTEEIEELDQRVSGKEVFRMEHLNFEYLENTPVLKDLNLLLDGRSTAVIGQNGAGKTTLVKLLKGLLKPVSGNV